MTTRRLVAIVIVLMLRAPAVWAGFCSAPAAGEPRHDFQFLAGYSPAASTLIGSTPDRRFVLAGFAYSYSCWIKREFSISYTGAILPAAIVLEPRQIIGFTPTPKHAVYGFGIMPLGFTFDFFRSARVHPFAEVLGGVIASTEPIPIDYLNASGLNFMFDFGGGIRWRLTDRRALSLGYKFTHISNAATTNFNPGLDNNLIYAGFSFLR